MITGSGLVFDKDRVNQVIAQGHIGIALIGYRKKGKALYEYLKSEQVKVPYIIERNYEALRYLENSISVPIVGFDESEEFYKSADVLLWSGDLPFELITECLELAGIKVPVVKVDYV